MSPPARVALVPRSALAGVHRLVRARGRLHLALGPRSAPVGVHRLVRARGHLHLALGPRSVAALSCWNAGRATGSSPPYWFFPARRYARAQWPGPRVPKTGAARARIVPCPLGTPARREASVGGVIASDCAEVAGDLVAGWGIIECTRGDNCESDTPGEGREVLSAPAGRPPGWRARSRAHRERVGWRANPPTLIRLI